MVLPGTYAFPTVIRITRTFALLPQVFTPNLNCFGFDKKTLFFVIDYKALIDIH